MAKKKESRLRSSFSEAEGSLGLFFCFSNGMPNTKEGPGFKGTSTVEILAFFEKCVGLGNLFSFFFLLCCYPTWDSQFPFSIL